MVFLLGMAQCAVAPAGKNRQVIGGFGDEAGVEKKSVLSCSAADANHAVLIRAGGDSCGGREDQVRFWQDGWCRVLAKVRWSMSCCAAARPLTDWSVELSHCRTLEISCPQQRGWPLLKRPQSALRFHDIVAASSEAWRSERTWWSLDRTIVLLPSRSSFLLVCPRLSC